MSICGFIQYIFIASHHLIFKIVYIPLKIYLKSIQIHHFIYFIDFSKMTVLGINGSPRSNWSTAKLVKKALEGAASNGLKTEFVDLGKLNFKGCVSCHACKKTPESAGKCYMKDDLSPVLEKIKKADALIFGSPTYYHQMSSLFHTFIERAMYSNLTYKDLSSVFGRKIKTAIIFNCGAAPEEVKELNYEATWKKTAEYIAGCYGSCEMMYVPDTMEVNDYSKVYMPAYDVEHKKKWREETFPLELQKAYELGKKITTK
ncbi:NADPH-dependent FMN reductase [Tritrichomonas foetus]|uniref:NADPH-dependent FMN reductase n=1 Tax=Tritrichomonas foetus TaxID=1144522 RepID=A0A1J4JJY3_9EUKA|nr:NADPH-dependent FMN reductase [Tritrichomonas foetus]|eukprot:OHS97835.1 NADPH-dependent FMN reductase [Tritrichomonas foetus]